MIDRPYHYVPTEADPGYREVTMAEWSAWLESHPPDKVPRRTEVGDRRVSTAFLGIDHYFGDDPNHPPVLWETMVFCDDHADPWDQCQWRYASRADALAHHDLVAEAIRSGVTPDAFAAIVEDATDPPA